MTVRFGPAGNSDSFYNSGHKSSLETFPWLREKGLDVFEYQCGHGARTREETARQLGEKARECGIGVSLHAPYYISLASKDEEKRLNSLTYILQSARIVDWMGGRRIVVHPGGLGGLSREGAPDHRGNPPGCPAAPPGTAPRDTGWPEIPPSAASGRPPPPFCGWCSRRCRFSPDCPAGIAAGPPFCPGACPPRNRDCPG